jgi:hypothetical protein
MCDDFYFLDVPREGCEEHIYVCDVYLQIDGVCEKSWESREVRVCLRGRVNVSMQCVCP